MSYLSVLLVSSLILSGKTLYLGDSCTAGSRPGRCSPLSECQPILAELKKVGSPIPAHTRKKLQSLTCGFVSYEPLVCCYHVENEDSDPYSEEWQPPTHQDMGTPSNSHRPQRPHTEDAGINFSPQRPQRPQTEGSGVNFNPQRPNRPQTGNNVGENQLDTERPVPNRDPNRPSNNNIDSHTSESTGSDDNYQDNDRPPDVRRHRNLHLLPTDCGVIESDRIWGGNRTRLYEMPWMVLIAYDSARGLKLSCGGTLITQRYILTAAHCVSFLGNRLKLSGIVLGEHDVREDPDCERVEGELQCAPSVRNVSIESVIPHPGYSPQNLVDDIALVRLRQLADFSLDTMKPICLPTSPDLQMQNLVGKQAVVAGWGATEDGLQSPVLLSVELPVVSNKECQSVYNGSPHIHHRQICAGGVQDKDSCGGDSGGPLMYPGHVASSGVRYVQQGIVSYGSKRCGVGGFPGVYTRVGFYVDWILDNIRS